MKFSNILTCLTAALILPLAPLGATAQDAESVPARITDFARVEASDDHTLGSEDAAITLIIWASVTCSHCGNWFTKEWPAVKSDLVETGKLRVVFREFPTAPGDLAMTGFRIAACAPMENYMSLIEYQMENQQYIFDLAKEGRAGEAYTKIAKMAGMETPEAINSCMKNPDIAAHIIDSADRAAVAGVKGVPGFLINGEIYKGPKDAETLVKLITDMDEKGLSSIPAQTSPAKPKSKENKE